MWAGSAGVPAFASSMMSNNLLLETVSKANDVAIWLKPISKNMGMKQTGQKGELLGGLSAQPPQLENPTQQQKHRHSLLYPS